MQNLIDINSVKLPSTFSEKRILRSNKIHLDEVELEAYDLKQYDYDTIFYDIFFDVRNRFLYTVGPPFLNLQKYLFPITCQINNDKKKHLLNLQEYFNNRIVIGKISLKNLNLYDENIIDFDFNRRFQWSGKIELNRHEVKPIILTTIQKDNRIRWIKEWIEFYSQNYNIDQTIIYDNNSSNRDDLRKISNKNLLIVAWDFKYGPIRSHNNQYCQLGSLNHCRLKFGSNNTIMNFDIDELLYLRNPKLEKYIKKYNLTLFNAYRVPFIKPISEDYSYKDFSFRDRYPQEGGRKYFYNPGNVIVNNIHSALIKRYRISLYRRLEALYYRLCRIKKKSRINSCLLNLMSMILRLKVVPFDEGYFLHYTGITNNWKLKYWDRKEETTLSDEHIRFNISKC